MNTAVVKTVHLAIKPHIKPHIPTWKYKYGNTSRNVTEKLFGGI